MHDSFNSASSDFEEIFKQNFDLLFEALCNYANTFLKDREKSKDVVQQVFVKWWEKRNEIQIHQTVKAYLYTSVYNQCMNSIRDEQVRKRYAEHHKKQETAITNFVDHVVFEEIDSRLKYLIDQLPAQCKLIFCKSRFENMTYNQIADQLNLSVKTIETQMTKALKTLRESMTINI